MTAVTQPAPWQERGVRLSAFPPLQGAAILLGVRVSLWVVVQLLIAAWIAAANLPGANRALDAAAGWWIAYHAVVDAATLAVLVALIRRHRVSYRSLLGPAARPWQIALGATAVVVASVPAVFFSGELTAATYGGDTLPMYGIVDVPSIVAVVSALVVPVLTELVEPVLYFAIVLPALERRLGHPLLAAPLVVGIWAVEHAFYPLLSSSGGIDLAFAGYRIVSVLPFLAVWTALYYAFGRRLVPIMLARYLFNAGAAISLALGAG